MRNYLVLSLCLIVLSPMPSRAQSPTSLETQENQLTYQELYESGIPFGTFLEQAEKRTEMWHDNFGKGSVPESIQQRLESLTAKYYLLAVAIDGCSDSVNTIPYLAHLSNRSDLIEMRIVTPDAGREIMEANRTPDDRAATPTVLVLDASFRKIGAFIERPSDLQAWALGEGKKLDGSNFMKAKFAWYDNDLGVQTMSEVLNIIESNIN